jgi:uncharacterized membrane protein YphA (DoxX/SURF4 family)
MAKAKAAKSAKTGKTTKDPGKFVFRLLQVYFAVALILVGLDKFFYMLNNWSIYLSPFVLKMCNCQDRPLMGVVGLIEIIVGIGVAIWPRVFSYLVCLFLILVIINLVMAGYYYDIVVHDVGLLVAAFSLAKLSAKYSGKSK